MRLPLPSTRKLIRRRAFSTNARRCVAIIAVVLVLAVVFAWALVPSRQDATNPAVNDVGQNEVSVRPVFSIAEIDGIDDVINAVRVGTDGTEGADIRAAVLPHHTLAGPKLMELWTEISDGSDPSVIVVIGPNHENAGEGMVQSTHGTWTSPFGIVQTDDGLIDRLVSLGIVSDEPESFVNEHAIGTHVPYLANLFPGVPIVPIIAKSPAGADNALSLVLVLQQTLPDDALIVSSVDFCHFLPQGATDAMDAETLAHVAGRRYGEIERLHSDHLDTPFALITYLLWSDRNGYAADLVWHETSHRLLGDPNAPGTSYLVFFSSAIPTDPPSSITLSFAGDIMLGRAVATVIAKTTVAQAFASAASAFEGSDLAFANIESVLTSSTQDTGKEIFFKADPARADVLQYLGLTHVSVANNHVDDYGRAGWEESLGHLNEAGVAPVGDYHGDVEPVVAETDGKNVVFLAYDDTYRPVDTERLAADIASADALGDMLVVSFHWGVEYRHTPTSRQKTLAYAAIDAGADVVVGHHPHVLQGVETYGGGLILYSLGNFVFDQIGEDENESVVAKVAWNGDGTRTLELVPMRVVGTFPRIATNEERLATLGRIVGWSDAEFPGGFATAGTLTW